MSAEPRILELEREVRATARLTTALLVLFILLVVGCGVFAYWRIRQALSPEALTEEVQNYVEAHAGEWKDELRKRIVRAAPKMARKMDRQTVTTLPQARANLEGYLERQMAADLVRAQAISDDEFRAFVRENRATVQKGFARLREAPRETDKLSADLERAVDRRLGVNLRKQSDTLLEGFRQLNAKLKRLSETGAPLSQTEKVEQRIVRILRALQIEGAKKVK